MTKLLMHTMTGLINHYLRGPRSLPGILQDCCRAFTSLPEVEFIDINLTKDLNFLLHAIHSLFYCRILQKTIRYSFFKTTYKKLRKTRKLESIHD